MMVVFLLLIFSLIAVREWKKGLILLSREKGAVTYSDVQLCTKLPPFFPLSSDSIEVLAK